MWASVGRNSFMKNIYRRICRKRPLWGSLVYHRYKMSLVAKLTRAGPSSLSAADILSKWRELIMTVFASEMPFSIDVPTWHIFTDRYTFSVKFVPSAGIVEKSSSTSEPIEILAALFCVACGGAAKWSGLSSPSPVTDPDEIYVYTDGSVNGETKAGGCAAVVVRGGRVLAEFSVGYQGVTSPLMELGGAILGLEKCLERGVRKCTVASDSEYVIKGFTMWLNGWVAKGWKTVNGAPVRNKDEWCQLQDIVRRFEKVSWMKVAAHTGDTYNERADVLAKNASEGRTV